jgi:hypothetical protein
MWGKPRERNRDPARLSGSRGRVSRVSIACIAAVGGRDRNARTVWTISRKDRLERVKALQGLALSLASQTKGEDHRPKPIANLVRKAYKA